jgi:hypothetical protein
MVQLGGSKHRQKTNSLVVAPPAGRLSNEPSTIFFFQDGPVDFLGTDQVSRLYLWDTGSNLDSTEG